MATAKKMVKVPVDRVAVYSTPIDTTDVFKRDYDEDYAQITVDVRDTDRINELLHSRFEIPAESVLFETHIGESPECVELLDKILTDEYGYDLIAKTGSGKTRGLLEKALSKFGFKLIFLVPLQANAAQIERDTVYSGKIKAVFDTVTHNEVKKYLKDSDVIVSTYDGLEKLLINGLQPTQYVIAIDEFHNIVLQTNFRAKVIRRVVGDKERFKKIIRITGTPESIFNKHLGSGWKRVRFKSTNERSNIKSYTIVSYGEEGIKKIASHIRSQNYVKKVVVLIQNKQHLKDLKAEMKSLGIRKGIAIINKDTKNSDDFKSITGKKKILSKTKYLLSTSVISDGVDIENEDIDAIYSLRIDDPILLRQFTARFRNAKVDFYDYIPGSNDDLVNIPSVKQLEKERKTFLTQVVSACNTEFDKSLLNKEHMDWLEFVLGAEIGAQCPIYVDKKGIFCRDDNMIRQQALRTLHSVAISHPVIRKLYMKMFEGWDAALVYDTSVPALSEKVQKAEIRNLILDYDNQIYEKCKDKELRILKRILLRLAMVETTDEFKTECLELIERCDISSEYKVAQQVSGIIHTGLVFHPTELYTRFCNQYGIERDAKIPQEKFMSVIKDLYLTKKTSSPAPKSDGSVSRANNVKLTEKRKKHQLFEGWS